MARARCIASPPIWGESTEFTVGKVHEGEVGPDGCFEATDDNGRPNAMLASSFLASEQEFELLDDEAESDK